MQYNLKKLTGWLRPAFSCLLILASTLVMEEVMAEAMAEEKSVIIIQDEDAGPIPEVEVYDRMFPIWGKEAVALGHEIPKPFGFSVIYMDLSQPLEVENIGFSGLSNNSLGLPINDNGLNIQTDVAQQEGKNITFRADMWLLPFLNVYAILGKTEGSSRTSINGINYDGNCASGFPGLDCRILESSINALLGLAVPEGTPFNLNYDGGTYGIGTTIAGGLGNWFVLTDMNYTYTDLNILDGRISTFVMSPRIGYRFKIGAVESRIWLGAMYQDVQQNFSGDIGGILPPPAGDLLPDSKFHVDQRLIERWNGTAGAMFEIDRSWEFLFEFGFGERKSAMGSLGYRF